MPDPHACTCQAKILSQGIQTAYPECAGSPTISVTVEDSGICDSGPNCPPEGQAKKPCGFLLAWTYQGTCATSNFKLFQWDGSSWQPRGTQAFGAQAAEQNFLFNPACDEKWKAEFSFQTGVVHWACEVECQKCGAALGGG